MKEIKGHREERRVKSGQKIHSIGERRGDDWREETGDKQEEEMRKREFSSLRA